jgi:nucleoside-diphosphate-sugar epimerase
MNTSSWFGGKTYNIGTGQSVPMNYIKNFINDRYDVEWTHTPSRNGDIQHALADISQTKKDLSWSPIVSIEEGLRKCFKGEKNES